MRRCEIRLTFDEADDPVLFEGADGDPPPAVGQ